MENLKKKNKANKPKLLKRGIRYVVIRSGVGKGTIG